MSNLEKLKSKICGYIDSCSVPSKQGLHKFIDTLPFELFVKEVAGYKIYVQPSEGDKESFKEFLISCGFGNDSVFWSCAGTYESGFLFDTSANMLCEFVVKDGLKRRYSVDLDSIPLDKDNIKRVILNEISSAQYKVTFTFDGILEDEIVSESATSASFDYRYQVQDKSLYDLLGIEDRELVLDIKTTRGDIPSVTGQVIGRNGYYTISYPIHGKASILVSSIDSDQYTIFKKAVEILTKNTSELFKVTRQTLEKVEKYA